jgi:DMSO reductase anchor subunit
MRPAWSVILLTTLIGAGQGLFLALFALAQADATSASPAFLAGGAAVSLALLAAGLVASFFHLGHPERAWRSAAMWRTSWLSREVIVLPAFMALLALWGAGHAVGAAPAWLALAGWAAAVACVALYVCTAMIYACLKFLEEWHSPLTVINYIVLGSASGLTLAAAYATIAVQPVAHAFALAALGATALGLATRGAALARNARLRHKSTLATAIGIKHPRITQVSQGAMGGSFNTREFFPGRPGATVRAVRSGFLVLAFVLPLALLALGAWLRLPAAYVAAFCAQFMGLLAERWYFFAEARHPQNLYYQAIA